MLFPVIGECLGWRTTDFEELYGDLGQWTMTKELAREVSGFYLSSPCEVWWIAESVLNMSIPLRGMRAHMETCRVCVLLVTFLRLFLGKILSLLRILNFFLWNNLFVGWNKACRNIRRWSAASIWREEVSRSGHPTRMVVIVSTLLESTKSCFRYFT